MAIKKKTKSTKKTKTTKRNITTARNMPPLSFEEYLDTTTWKMTPISIPGIEKFAQELLEWAMTKDAIILRKYFRERGVCMGTVERWAQRSSKFKTALDMAHQAIGDRIYEGGLIKKYDSSLVGRGLARYDREWKKLEAWRAKLKVQEQEQKTTTFNINIPTYEEPVALKGKKNDGSGKDI